MERILKGKSDRSQSKVGIGEEQMAKQMGNQAMVQMYQDIIQFQLVSLRQSGPNCGIFAMAMAIQEFIGGDGNVIAQELQECAGGCDDIIRQNTLEHDQKTVSHNVECIP